MYVANLLKNFGAYVNILFIIKLKILIFNRWSYGYPLLCSLLNLKWFTYFDWMVQ